MSITCLSHVYHMSITCPDRDHFLINWRLLSSAHHWYIPTTLSVWPTNSSWAPPGAVRNKEPIRFKHHWHRNHPIKPWVNKDKTQYQSLLISKLFLRSPRIVSTELHPLPSVTLYNISIGLSSLNEQMYMCIPPMFGLTNKNCTDCCSGWRTCLESAFFWSEPLPFPLPCIPTCRWT